jgi:hypothetical protein
MSLRAWNPEAQGQRYKAHTNRFKRMRSLAKDITLQGTSRGAPLRGLIAQWWKLDRKLDYSMRERFTPPPPDGGTRWKDVFNSVLGRDKNGNWPDPGKFRMWVVARNQPDTFRWAYRKLKRMAATA